MRVLRLKNSYTKSIEVFEPLDPQRRVVKMYSCGPTVYSFAHIGNFRSFLFADLLRRVLTRHGYEVHQVMNVTDVGHMTEDHVADASGEDRMSKAARELGTDPYAVAAHFEEAFVRDAKLLGLALYQPEEADRRELHPRATAYIAEMLVMIQQLLDRGFAYIDGSGQVYFEVAKFPEYGRLSGKVIDELEVGSRVAVRDEKRDPRDFALWKVDDKHLMKWDPHSPEGWAPADHERFRKLAPNGVDRRIGRGFPGWHIECSAMSRALLGATIDIHTGGEDNVFPHHECEIAQSYGADGTVTRAPASAEDAGTDRPTFARYWVHGRHLLVDGKKMAKRDGNFYTTWNLLDPVASGAPHLVEKLAAVGFASGSVPPRILRYALLSNSYTQPMNFTFDLLAQAKSSVERLQSRWERLREEEESGADGEARDELHRLLADKVEAFDAALDDNLNTPNALAALFELTTGLNLLTLHRREAGLARAALEGIDAVLGVLDRRPRAGLLATATIAERAATIDWASAGVASEVIDQELVERCIVARQAARKAKDFAAADRLRDQLKQRGVIIEDAAQGVRWKISS